MSFTRTILGIVGGAALLSGVTAAWAAQELCTFGWNTGLHVCDNAPVGGLRGDGSGTTSGTNVYAVTIDYRNTVSGGSCTNVPQKSGVEFPAICKATDTNPGVNTVPRSCSNAQVPTAHRIFCSQ